MGIRDHLDSIRDLLTVEDSFAGHFQTIEFLLNALGLNIFDPRWFKRESLTRKVTCFAYLCLLLACVFFAFFSAFVTFKHSLEDQLSSILASFFALQIAANIGVLFVKCDNYRNIKRLIMQYIQEGQNGEDLVYQPILAKYQKMSKIVFHWMKIMYVQALVVLITVPQFSSKPWVFPINFAIPGVSINSYPGYTINYWFISISSTLGVFLITGFDAFVILMSIILASRFELCGEHFSKIAASDINERAHILHGLKIHAQTMEFFHLCRDTMEPIIFLKMFNVLLLTCCQLGIFLLNPFNQTILTFFSTMSQIFLYSVCGELVAAKAFEVSVKLYGSQWYNMQDEGLKKALIVVLNRSQQNCYFSIGSYAPLSIGTFTTITSMTYKCFNFMRNAF